MPDPNDEARALLHDYARATTPSPAEIEHALTRTLARVDAVERSARLPDRRRRLAWVAAAGLASLVLATAAIAGIRWYRGQPKPQPESYGAAQSQRSEPELDGRATPRPSAGAVPAPAPAPEVESSPAVVEARPTLEPAPRRRARPKPAEAQPAPSDSAPADASVLAEESRLLARARRALRDDDFEAALEWTEEHARRHPQGSLSEERLILEAVAACRGDQRARGLAAHNQLREQFPETAALAKVEQACAGP